MRACKLAIALLSVGEGADNTSPGRCPLCSRALLSARTSETTLAMMRNGQCLHTQVNFTGLSTVLLQYSNSARHLRTPGRWRSSTANVASPVLTLNFSTVLGLHAEALQAGARISSNAASPRHQLVCSGPGTASRECSGCSRGGEMNNPCSRLLESHVGP